MKKFSKSFWVVIFTLIALSIYLGKEGSSEPIRDMIFSDLVTNLNNNNIKKIIIQNNNIISLDNKNRQYKTHSSNISNQIAATSALKAKVAVEYVDENFWVEFFKYNFIHILFLILFFFLSNAKLPDMRSKFKIKLEKKYSFSDIAGADEAKEELQEIIEFLKNPKKFTSIGAKIPKGILLCGEPGTGKTLLAKAVSNEAQCNFFYASGSQFDEMFVGVGASRMRALFEEAKSSAPSIIFIDEIDVLGQKRNKVSSNVGDQTLNEFLSQLDGFTTNSGIIVFGATNRLESMDKALLRPGRLGDRIIKISLPSMQQRKAILEVHAKNIKLDNDINLSAIAKRTIGFSGASLANIVNEAALLAAKNDKKNVSQEEFIKATEKVDLGPINKTHIMNEEEKKRTSYHESGHALIAKFFESKNKIHQITILPRGNALGYVTIIPKEEKDSYSQSKKEFLTDAKIALGGYAAEELIFGKENVSSGPSNDLAQVTKLIKKLVMFYGMSDLGLISHYPDEYNNLFPTSNESLSKIESEVSSILKKLYSEVYDILKKNQNILTHLCETLMLKETMDSDEIDEFFTDNTLN